MILAQDCLPQKFLSQLWHLILCPSLNKSNLSGFYCHEDLLGLDCTALEKSKRENAEHCYDEVEAPWFDTGVQVDGLLIANSV